MCLLFFSYKTTPGFRLVVAANRDEFLARPTAPLDFLDKDKTILGGRDLQGGGTWLGISSRMKFAAITNYRESAVPMTNAPSRGEILMEYLEGELDAGQFVHILEKRAKCYNGFNLILGDNFHFYYFSNRAGKPQLLSPGFYGLSNHLLDTPWPKVVRGKRLLYQYMVAQSRADFKLDKLFVPLADNHRPSDDELPDTGIGLEYERLLSTIFIDSANYGTRSSAVISVTEDSRIEFMEKTILRNAVKETSHQIVHHVLND